MKIKIKQAVGTEYENYFINTTMISVEWISSYC